MVRKDVVDEIDDYEAQRQANIKANLELMMSLGLYQGSTLLNPKQAPSTPKPKPQPKPKTASPAAGSEDGESKVERPRRITRSVSRVLDSPQRKGGGMKRALSDDFIYPTRKHSRADDEYDSDSFDLSSDDDSSYSHRRTSSNSLNPSRHYRPDHTLQRQADRLGTRIHNPKTFGHIFGIPIGTHWSKRMDCSTDAVHAPTVAGISGNDTAGCWSICLSGGYEDDVDLGDTFTYTGSGGRDLKGTVNNPKNLRTAPQSSDQRWDGKNASLKRSVETGRPVRVVRGYKGENRYSPREGYVYSGLYRVERAWMERGASGFMVCRFEFRRLPGQAPLSTFDEEEGAQAEGNDDKNEEVVQAKDEEDEVQEISARAVRAMKRFTGKPSSLNISSSPSPAPSSTSIRSTTSSRSPHPILKSPNADFDRASYIIIDDSDDEPVLEKDEEEVLMQLELPSLARQMAERAVRQSPRRAPRVRYTR